jgi:hypothetical protein
VWIVAPVFIPTSSGEVANEKSYLFSIIAY